MISKNKQTPSTTPQRGTILAEDVLDHWGCAMPPAGGALSAPVLTSMRRRGIDQAHFVANSVSAEQLAQERARVSLRLDARQHVINATSSRQRSRALSSSCAHRMARSTPTFMR